MSKRRNSIRTIETGLSDHPAVTAWRTIQANGAEPARIAVLKDNQHSSVYRLDGIGRGGASLIAKRSTLGSLLTERAVYEKVLAKLPARNLRCYGFLEHEDAVSGWLFLEDAGSECYSADLAEHRALAAKWLGATHASSAELSEQCQLPGREPVYFWKLLVDGTNRLRNSLSNSALSPENREVVTAILSHLQVLADHWEKVEQHCERAPRTLVHGDLKSKNLRIRNFADGPVLFALDWEVAGWATPAVDLYFIDELELYLETVRQTWPHLSLDDLQVLRNCGRFFRLVASVYWAASGLEQDWLDRTMRHLTLYCSRLDGQIRAAGWRD